LCDTEETGQLLGTRWLNIKEVVCKKLRGVPRLGKVLYEFRLKQENEMRNTTMSRGKKSRILLASTTVGTVTAWIGYCL